jgi:hypothetical protein
MILRIQTIIYPCVINTEAVVIKKSNNLTTKKFPVLELEIAYTGVPVFFNFTSCIFQSCSTY